MARFVMANRRSGKFTHPEKLASRESMSDVLNGSFMTGSRVVRATEPRDETGRHLVLFEAESEEIQAKTNTLPGDVMVEEEIHHHWDPNLPLGLRQTSREDPGAPVDHGDTARLVVEVRSEPDQKPLRGAEVNLFFRGLGLERKSSAVTDGRGRAVLEFESDLHPSAAVAMPAGEHWPMVVQGASEDTVISCPALPGSDEHIGWWHNAVGIAKYRSDSGRGVRVGVIDTGAGPHPALDHVKIIGAYIDADFDPAAGQDVHSHGSHICGIIGARPTGPNGFGGIAPGASLYSARIFPAEGAATQLAIAHAIDELSRHENVDLINMSLGADRGSDIARDAITDALERGTLCICAAGNTAGDVMYPGAFPDAVAVSALGRIGWGPPGSVPSMRAPDDRARFGDGDLFLDMLSCHGDGVTAAAPGVGIVSTVPERFGMKAPYASNSGTSMAASVVCGALASLLARSPEYKALPRHAYRAVMARRILRQNCRSVGLEVGLEGRGVPRV